MTRERKGTFNNLLELFRCRHDFLLSVRKIVNGITSLNPTWLSLKTVKIIFSDLKRKSTASAAIFCRQWIYGLYGILRIRDTAFGICDRRPRCVSRLQVSAGPRRGRSVVRSFGRSSNVAAPARCVAAESLSAPVKAPINMRRAERMAGGWYPAITHDRA